MKIQARFRRLVSDIFMIILYLSDLQYLKYLRKTKDLLLVYGESNLRVEVYIDLSFQSDVDDSKSNSRYVFILNEGAVC